MNNFDKIVWIELIVFDLVMVLQIRDFQKIIKNRVESFHNDELKSEDITLLGPYWFSSAVKENTAKSKMLEELSAQLPIYHPQ